MKAFICFLAGFVMGAVFILALTHRFIFYTGGDGGLIYRCNRWTGEVQCAIARDLHWREITPALVSPNPVGKLDLQPVTNSPAKTFSPDEVGPPK
jgi:hypothetical protein